ncbi:MAG: flagellar motor stator protein MotA [Armatimonadota bacterium]
MLIVGLLVVLGAVLGGFIMAGGKVAVLIQVAEIVVIVGAATGSILVGNKPSFLGHLVKEVMGLLKPSPYTKAAYMNLLKMMFNLFNVARRDGLLALESHIERPEESDLFKRCPELLADHHALAFFADSTKVVLTGAVAPHDLMEMMEIDVDIFGNEVTHAAHVVQHTGDAMPGFGIVAAVLGVIITMGSIGGHHVAAALVGTMLGVLLAYGIVGPIGQAMLDRAKQRVQFMHCIRYALFSFARGESPITCVEFARRNIDPEIRPSFTEMETEVRKKDAA